jgi:hypothetical protein
MERQEMGTGRRIEARRADATASEVAPRRADATAAEIEPPAARGGRAGLGKNGIVGGLGDD